MKQCKKCLEFKVTNDFYTDPNRKDGLYPWCKKCKKGYLRGRYVESFSREYDLTVRCKKKFGKTPGEVLQAPA